MSYRSTLPLVITFLCIASTVIVAAADIAEQRIGPLVGHTDAESATVWARLPFSGPCTLDIRPAGADGWESVQSIARKEDDFCVTWKVGGLRPSTRYDYRLKQMQTVLAEGPDFAFSTAPAEDTPTSVCIAVGSCAAHGEGSRAVWNRIRTSKVDAVLLLGDTPYIDSTSLDVQRSKYREFSSVSEFEALTRSVPFWDTWDDHDFGANDSDGTLPGKENSRKAFLEYRPNGTFGNGAEGVYTRFRYGPVEVFLLDTRWWSWTEPSFADPSQKTLLGQEQWRWLTEGLRDSKATFKLIACGMIWDDKENSEKDDWGTYMYERDALFAFIGEERISGVVLIGGDIHVTRVLRYKTEEQVGYPLYQFITSPIHNRVIPSLNVPHPDLIRDAVCPHTFMKLTADSTVEPATLRAQFIDKDGQPLFEDIKLTIEQLTPQ